MVDFVSFDMNKCIVWIFIINLGQQGFIDSFLFLKKHFILLIRCDRKH